MDIVNGDGLDLFLSSLELKKVSFLFIKKKVSLYAVLRSARKKFLLTLL